MEANRWNPGACDRTGFRSCSRAAADPAQPGPEQGHRHIDGGMCPMMGMIGGESDSPRMTQTRGEMPKAMGEGMMKYGKMMEGGSR